MFNDVIAPLSTHVAKWGIKNEISFRSRTSGCPHVQSLKLSEGSISDMEVQENGDLEGCEAIIAIMLSVIWAIIT